MQRGRDLNDTHSLRHLVLEHLQTTTAVMALVTRVRPALASAAVARAGAGSRTKLSSAYNICL